MCEWGETLSVRLDGKSVSIDRCIAPLVEVLNRGGIRTLASCCGHGKGMGNIVLGDGRELEICPDFETARRIDAMWAALGEDEPDFTMDPDDPTHPGWEA